MLLLILCIILFFNCIISYLCFKKFLSVSLICNFVFLFSCLFLLLYSNELNFHLNLKTFFLILFSLIFVFIGEIVTKYILIKKPKKNFDVINVEISQLKLFICFLFSFISFMLYLKDTIQLSLQYYGTPFGFIENIKNIKIAGNFVVSTITSQLYLANQILSEILVFYFLKKLIVDKKIVKNVFFYLSICFYCCTVLLTATRSRLLNLFIYGIIVSLLLIYWNSKNEKTFNKKNELWKFFRKIIPLFCILLLLFYLSGFLTGKALQYNSIGENLLNYCGMSIYNLNYYLENATNSIFNDGTSFFGIHTLSGIYSFLRNIGFDIPEPIIALEYIQSPLVLGNVFTPLRRYYQDFGLIGVALISFFVGFIYKYLINKSQKYPFSFFALISIHFIYPIFFWSIEDRLFMDVLLFPRNLYEVFYIIIFSSMLFCFNVKKYTIKYKNYEEVCK